MSDLNRAADVAALEGRVVSLEAQLAEARLVAATNGISCEARVTSPAPEQDVAIVLTVNRGGKVVTFSIRNTTAMFYKNDVTTLATELAEKSYEALFKDGLRDQIANELSPAIANLVKISGRSSL